MTKVNNEWKDKILSWIPLDKPLEITINQGVDKEFLVYPFNAFKQRINLEISTLLQQQREEVWLEGYKKGVRDEIECVKTSGEHLNLQIKLKEEKINGKQ